MFENSQILITGGTGSFGQAFTKIILERFNPKRLVIYSRDEMKQWDMANKFGNDKRIRFFIGDIRDKERLYRAMDGIDYVIHAAASKIVETAEYNPFECIKTNIYGAMNLIDVCIDKNVKRVIALSTDKACNPSNLYGASKLASDKLFISGNSYSSIEGTKFSVVRYGNVLASRGSVIPFFMNIAAKGEGKLPITDERMTRFMITLEEGIDLVFLAFNNMIGGEIYVKKIPSMKVIDIAECILPNEEYEVVGIRPGEKIHEQMITAEDSPHTYEYGGFYKILPAINNWNSDNNRIGDGKKVKDGFVYSSDNNDEWMSQEDLKKWINYNIPKIGKL